MTRVEETSPSWESLAGLATDLLGLALSDRRGPVLRRTSSRRLRSGRWPVTLSYALAVSCLVDLAESGRVACRGRGGVLFVRDGTPTGGAAHDAVLVGVAQSDWEHPPSAWVHRLGSVTSRLLLQDAVRPGVEPVRCWEWGLFPRTRYLLADRSRADALMPQLDGVLGGRSVDPDAVAMLTLLAVAPLAWLVPSRPSPRALYRWARRLPPALIVSGFRSAAQELCLEEVGDVAALFPYGSDRLTGSGGGA